MATLTLLQHLGVLRASGPDARGFLQSQLTNDIDELDARTSQLTAWCDPKGRVQILFRALCDGDDILLVAPQSVVAAQLPKLRMYVLRRKARLEQDSTLAIAGIHGEDARSLLQGGFGETLPTPGVASYEGCHLVALDEAGTRWLLIGPGDAVNAQIDRLRAAGAAAGSDEDWHLATIAAGEPEISDDVSGEFVPQMLNLELLGGVNFNKGCYPGQEIVARSQYLGRIKRRTLAFDAEPGQQPTAGSAVLDGSGKSAGKVLYGAPRPSGDISLLVVVSTDAAAGAALRLADGRALKPRSLPYSLES